MNTHIIESLEPRIAPSVIFVLDDNNHLRRFDSATPGTIDADIPITGLGLTDVVRGIDFRPATGELFAFAVPPVPNNALIRTYSIDPDTGAATLIGTIPNTIPGAGDYPTGFDFNPTVDRMRVVQSDNENFRINPNNGAVAGDDPNLTYTPPAAGPIIAEAYDRNYARASASVEPTTLYGIDRGANRLVVQGAIDGAAPGGANGGVISAIGLLGFTLDAARDGGFDIENKSGIAYAALTDNADHLTRLYTIDLASGAATAVGLIGNGSFEVRGLSVPTPTVTLVNATTATYLDADGDRVTVKVNKGTLDRTDLRLRAAANGGGQLGLVNFSNDGTEFDGANLTISVRKSSTGDGLAAVGYINANGIDLGKVVVPGDLARIDAGNPATSNAAIASLSVNSFGRFGSPLFGLHSIISGPVGKITVKTDVRDVFIELIGTDGTLGSLSIGGSLIGGAGADTGVIQTSAGIGTVKIGRDVVGGPSAHSGAVNSGATMGKVSIGGSVVGGSASNSGLIESTGAMGAVSIGRNVIGGTADHTGNVHSMGGIASVKVRGSIVGGNTTELDSGIIYSFGGTLSDQNIGAISIGGSLIGTTGFFGGSIFAQNNLGAVTISGGVVGGGGESSASITAGGGSIGALKIGGSLIGGTGRFSGEIFSSTGIASLTIGGSAIGGSGDFTGGVFCAGDVGKVKIAGDLRGGSISGTQLSVDTSGYIEAKRIASVSIGGSVLAGIDSSASGELSRNASIRAVDDLGAVTIKGNLVGSIGSNSDVTMAVISARGQLTPGSTDVAIKSLSIGGSVERARILAGYDVFLTVMNADAQIGNVSVGGDWAASDLVAGIAATNLFFGDADDAVPFAGGNAAIVSRIASVVIKGQVIGSTFSSVDRLGFVAQQIGSFKAAGFTAPLTAATDAPIPLSIFTGDVTIREL